MIEKNELRKSWRNIWCILRSIDQDEVQFETLARKQEWDRWHWSRFREDPHGFFVRCDTFFADAIWAAVEKRL